MTARKLPVGAGGIDGGVHFRVGAPKRRRVDVVVDGRTVPLDPETDGSFGVHVAGGGSGVHQRRDAAPGASRPARLLQEAGPSK
jgi:maltooligosyltrehalose trehalohydrolase